MILLLIQALIVIILAMTLSTVIADERKNRKRNMRSVKLKGFWSGAERRSVDRYNVSLLVKYYMNGTALDVKAKDISSRGIRLLLDEKIENGTSLRLEISLPGKDGVLKGRGKVVWVEEAKEDEATSPKRLFNTGIKFVWFRDSDGKKLFDFIYGLPSRKP